MRTTEGENETVLIGLYRNKGEMKVFASRAYTHKKERYRCTQNDFLVLQESLVDIDDSHSTQRIGSDNVI